MTENIKKRYSKKLPKFINQNQFLSMIDHINTDCFMGARNYAMLMIMFRAGLRVSEVANLALQDIDFNTQMIYIQDSKGDKDRYIPMDVDIIKSAKRWLEFRPDNAENFFCTYKGGQLDVRYIREMTYNISRKAEIYIQNGREKKKVNPHALRHGFATESLRNEEFNIRELQQLMGHSDVSTTQVYTSVVMEDLKKKFNQRKSITG